MAEETQGLSLEGLAQRLEALEGENAELRGEVAALKGAAAREGELAAGKAPKETGRRLAKHSVPGTEEAVSRRAMLTKAGAAAAAVLAGGVLLAPREAKADQFFPERVVIEPPGGTSVTEIGSVRDAAVYAEGFLGKKGVFGASLTNHGVHGTCNNVSYAGVFGTNVNGVAVRGETSKTDYASVYGQHTGTSGVGVLGDGKGPAYPGVLGRNPSGYGGSFEGGKAQLRLTPKGSTGRPKSGSHQKGEIYLDSAASVFVCTKSGTPGTWKKLSSTLA